ncbi:Glucose-methanol-choline (GMC) oxidoreductase family protein [Rhynchospora pubera]|uniref:Glucose-methanol-choline (GMC) oxidoreductase family protein n=1 Tax=Rhynchospora pubera TaxID=906938 RepID=A0AAV8BXY0_9POAL|nr:Glucose-methanol-choline (GMC) oxidoreductase family protein [Rhynchospora pubera]
MQEMAKNLPLLLLLLSHGLFFLHVATATPRSYHRFTQDATQFPAISEYDYIIVGGGAAGCPLAATLSGGGSRVLLLERGGAPDEYPSLATASGFLPTISTTSQDSPAQPFSSEEGVANIRARVLGGGSAINAGFYSRAHPEFFTDVPFNWDLHQVNKSYEWIERALVHRPDVRGWQAALRDGLIEAGVSPYNGFTVEHMTGTKIGGSIFDAAGRRHSAADLLAYARHDRIRVATRATVDRIFLHQVQTNFSSVLPATAEATGVVFLDRLGRRHHAMTRRGGEVILCAGALGSPQLLLLSGVGPRAYLATWGIPVAVDNPDVGEYLYDNPRNGISILPPGPIDHSLIQVVGIPDGGDAFLEAASYVVPFVSPVESILFHRTAAPLYINVATIMEKVAGPASFGSLRLASLDPHDSPFVRFNYFTDPSNLDLNRCVSGLRRVGDVLQSRSMTIFRPAIGTWLPGGSDVMRGEFHYVGSPLPANRSDDDVMRGFCRRNVATLWHYHGGCVAGKVVDREFRVIGTRGLRVVDGSVLTVSPGTNPQATIMMMGRYVGQRILAGRRYMRNRRRHTPPAAAAAPPPPDL